MTNVMQINCHARPIVMQKVNVMQTKNVMQKALHDTCMTLCHASVMQGKMSCKCHANFFQMSCKKTLCPLLFSPEIPLSGSPFEFNRYFNII